MHHLVEVVGMSLRTVEYCVFDEADRLFEMGFSDQVGSATRRWCTRGPAELRSRRPCVPWPGSMAALF
jgi:hypothetical protein